MWFILSGASSYMAPKLYHFQSCHIYIKPFSVEVSDKSAVTAEGRGKEKLCINVLGIQMKCFIQDVLYVPGFQFSLISIGTLGRRGIQTTFTEKGASIAKDVKFSACRKALGEL